MITRRQALSGAASLLLACAAPPALAAKFIELTKQQTASLQQISDYINGFRHLRGEFTQVSPKGNMSQGVFFIMPHDNSTLAAEARPKWMKMPRPLCRNQ